MTLGVTLLVDHPDLLEPLTAAYQREWPEWYGKRGDAMHDLRERARTTGLPIGWAAVERGEAIGTVAIAETSIRSHMHLSPWIVGFWVKPSRRNQGIGARLLEAACVHARHARMGCLYAATAQATTLFIREGWSLIGVGGSDLGGETKILQKHLLSR